MHSHDNLCSCQSQAAFQTSTKLSVAAASRCLPTMPPRRSVGPWVCSCLLRWIARRCVSAPLPLSTLRMRHPTPTEWVFPSLPGLDYHHPRQSPMPSHRWASFARDLGKSSAPVAKRTDPQRDGASGQPLVQPVARRLRLFVSGGICTGKQCRLISRGFFICRTLPKAAMAGHLNLS